MVHWFRTAQTERRAKASFMNDATVPEPAKGTDVVMRKLSVALVGWKNRPHATFQSGGAVSDDMFAARLRVGPGVAARRGGAATALS